LRVLARKAPDGELEIKEGLTLRPLSTPLLERLARASARVGVNGGDLGFFILGGLRMPIVYHLIG
jgi:hypothetical protein